MSHIQIGCRLIEDHSLRLLDEPTSNLDVKHQVYVTELLRAIAIKQNKLIIMIGHDLNIAAKYAHKIIVMSKPGVIYKIGNPKDNITPETVRDVYGIDCKVIDDEGVPHVILKAALRD